MPQTLHYCAALTVTGDDGGFPRFRRRFGLFFKKQAESPRLFDTSVAGNTFGVDNWTDIPVVTYGPLLLAASGGKNRSQDKKGQYGLFSTGQQDRKSTRLNSSHVKISYAVFCLKQK